MISSIAPSSHHCTETVLQCKVMLPAAGGHACSSTRNSANDMHERLSCQVLCVTLFVCNSGNSTNGIRGSCGNTPHAQQLNRI